ncbi:hypothetical protein [Candidatus Mycoplasma haematominutum]|uniref:hypothetical protein n=1 Tax=Candidatus Mycoplasma haematominutum TaxID=209446 RepID=UPI0011B5167E|nr:hypothetical protein [Candidatus Mycoplasma haematominutum]
MNGQPSGFDIAACVLAFLGATTITLSFWPQFIATFRSKNSAVVPFKIFAFHLATSCALFVGALFGLPGLISCTPGCTVKLVRLMAFVYINTFLLFTCGYIFYLKMTNSKKAQNLGISEENYCKYYLNPLVRGKRAY